MILVLALTNFAFAKAYRDNIGKVSIEKLDLAIFFFTLMVFYFLMVIIGSYLQRRVTADKLSSKENA